ncbi:MAG: hypothetical protein A3H06_02310 [Candidatus Colwellbacteria bacterium RIFCSPLOWO2_12_FULL_44_13]|uniref:DUF5671 domain-containing protein n=3 Tax=Candidatus Colwelliibacteriota TaxID=1817904 RepID=A0A1G1Z644_9BACT|nr:MAG: hypothetical protein A3F24_01380 [Candidatus Colwellbacteria bacterium RIFCSPHIGHO2_12_FULL_44_17]OGY59909.1 MAG: hypothetical protein A3I31_02005 [Candidatus Colwellbacteria bacterium RIFCSPLOWO2_02_FULL_44_20b]OGY61776.1 MAG: hypothetical protein A3H06_02310 [Candidatus Colwellbacteria bacterium RIFCSPLOWO2_12_FULL_44_13]
MNEQQIEKQMPVKASPRDVFLHLLGMVTLYASAISFLTIIFQLVNLYVPDIAANDFYYGSAEMYQKTLRTGISFLVVFFPVYILTSWFLNKIYTTNPDKRNLRIRKWLIYFTLFAAAIVIMGFLVKVINDLLEGELTVRFGIKVASVIFVAGSIFWYHLRDLKKNKNE